MSRTEQRYHPWAVAFYALTAAPGVEPRRHEPGEALLARRDRANENHGRRAFATIPSVSRG
ncbi:hypothetical protein MAPG_10921 [Magnaporthiopsis poae ATCC 64411]|uniref:Uncharacterized protein n=1 Tax=Magnaporthiopsis poae (strain ATCC 64411 / 73-15) TaxID=644358 RepID=A0A0C4EDW0_MAGP6|nr:hypothetical protein MAPG_10921 [Magnaporthiopsis poae ATCC 64411]